MTYEPYTHDRRFMEHEDAPCRRCLHRFTEHHNGECPPRADCEECKGTMWLERKSDSAPVRCWACDDGKEPR